MQQVWLPNRSTEAQLVAPLGQAGYQSACTQAVLTDTCWQYGAACNNGPTTPPHSLPAVQPLHAVSVSTQPAVVFSSLNRADAWPWQAGGMAQPMAHGCGQPQRLSHVSGPEYLVKQTAPHTESVAARWALAAKQRQRHVKQAAAIVCIALCTRAMSSLLRPALATIKHLRRRSTQEGSAHCTPAGMA